MSYTFRWRIKISEIYKLGIDEEEIVVSEIYNKRIILRSHKKGQSIKNSNELILKGTGYETKETAKLASEESRDRLSLAFSQLRLPANFGDRAAHSQFFKSGLKMLEKQFSSAVLNDTHGLQIYKTELNPKFAKLEGSKLILIRSSDSIIKMLTSSFTNKIFFSEKKRLAYELFSASIFSSYVDSRFMLLMMAIETLIEQKDRSIEERDEINKLIEILKLSSIAEKESIINGLNQLKKESVGMAGRRLASQLSDNYMEKNPRAFYNFCYNLRSKLVHGAVPRPGFDDISKVNASLEQFVADLICISKI